jgi:subtilisin family serine protease
MYAYRLASQSPRLRNYSGPSDELRVAVTFRRPDGGPGPTKFDAPLSLNAVRTFIPDPLKMDQAIHELTKWGFKLTQRGQITASMRCSRETLETVFHTKLSPKQLDPKQAYAFHSFYFPAQDAQWKPAGSIGDLIDDVYVQWPHIYMAKKKASATRKKVSMLSGSAGASGSPSATPPPVDYFHLEMPKDVPALLKVDAVHKAGTTGQGVRVVMVDSGFAHGSHPFFKAHGFKSTVDLAPHADNDKTDPNGHGTGESTNIFAVAPGATFIGVKVDNDEDPRQGASMLEGFQAALQHQPHIISISMGYDLRNDSTGKQLAELPGSLAALEAEVQAAVASGIVVVFSAGNGHFSFPGMMPDVISAGGVFVDQTGNMKASDYASAFESKIYSGRHVPDFCGLVGMLPHATYIMFPIPGGCEIDHETSQPQDGSTGDGTVVDDGWGVFSGTSAAAPQLAGVCALLLSKNPGLKPTDIKAILRRTARDVASGHANPASSDDGVPMQASTGDDGATGAGLVDAFAAWQQA